MKKLYNTLNTYICIAEKIVYYTNKIYFEKMLSEKDMLAY